MIRTIPDRPDRQHFYTGDWDDRELWRRPNGNRFQAIGTIQNYPRIQQFFPRFHSACASKCRELKSVCSSILFLWRRSKSMSTGIISSVHSQLFPQCSLFLKIYRTPKRFSLGNFLSLLLNTLQQGQGLLFGPSPAGPRVWDNWDVRGDPSVSQAPRLS